jgi:hypothetical protein
LNVLKESKFISTVHLLRFSYSTNRQNINYTETAQRLQNSEQTVMTSKIAAVRDVVKNVSNNDIALVLHNYDMDVERTIQALCERMLH